MTEHRLEPRAQLDTPDDVVRTVEPAGTHLAAAASALAPGAASADATNGGASALAPGAASADATNEATNGATADATNGVDTPDGRIGIQDAPTVCTQAQLRRFIKSRPYVPLHELRRRFGLNGSDDDVALVDVDGKRLFVGLPARESGLLGDLMRQGDVGYELLLDPTSPLVIGVFPIRPVQRP